MTAARVRPLLPTDKAKVVDSMAKAFDRDIPFNYGIRQDAQRAAAFQLAFRTVFDRFLPYGMSHVVEDGLGAAFWCRHDQWVLPIWRELLLLPIYVRCSGLDRLRRLVRVFDAMKAHDPKEPHHYLFAIGVDSAAQGRGLGAELMRHQLALCDREGLPAYLESTSSENRAFYLRHGFEVTAEFPIGEGDAPVLTGMWRPPASAASAVR